MAVSAPHPRGGLWLETWNRRENLALLFHLLLFPTSSVPNTLCYAPARPNDSHIPRCAGRPLSSTLCVLFSTTTTPHCPTQLSSGITSSTKPRQLITLSSSLFFLLSFLLKNFLKAINVIDIVSLIFLLPNRSRLMMGTKYVFLT